MDVRCSIKMAVSADLSECALADAIARLKEHRQEPTALIVSPGDAVVAGRLAERYGIKRVVVLPILEDFAWALVGSFLLVYSEGA